MLDTNHVEENGEHCCACDEEDHEHNSEESIGVESPAIDDLLEDYNQFGN